MVSNNMFSLLLVCNLHLNEAKKHSKAIYAANINIKYLKFNKKANELYFYLKKQSGRYIN